MNEQSNAQNAGVTTSLSTGRGAGALFESFKMNCFN